MLFRRAWLGTTILLLRCALDKGLVSWFLNHDSTAPRSYEWPSSQTTGSIITWQMNAREERKLGNLTGRVAQSRA